MTDSPDGRSPLRDGRYVGKNSELRIEMRIDVRGSGVISGDLFRANTPGREHLATVRTAPGEAVTGPDGSWPAQWQSYYGETSTGRLAVEPAPGDSDAATVRLRLDRALSGLPADTDLEAGVRWASVELRPLGLETELEEGVEEPGAADFNGTAITFRDCLRQAGFAVRDVGARTRIPPRAGGWDWDTSVVYGVLDDVMQENAQAGLDLPSWQVHLLMLAKPALSGLYGVMFDVAEILPRQGCAVFVDEIRLRTPVAERNRRLVHTVVHEVGHAFNLAHRFERVLGRADSTSFMNYSQRYLGGEDAYWQQFGFGFDEDELAFLRHGPRGEVMPGASPFHSANYWSTASGTFPAFVPETPTPGLELTLETPANGGVFEFGQPVFLGVRLANTGSDKVTLPGHALDIKTGYLEILVERLSRSGRPHQDGGRSFVPIAQRCMDVTVDQADLVPGGPPLRENVNLSYGADGFVIDDPGRYRLTPLLTLADPDAGRNGPAARVVRGRPLVIQVAYPRSREDERHAVRLLQSKVGAWFALGGSEGRTLAGAQDEVAAIRDERPSTDRPDPIAAAIARTLGLHAGRSYLRLRDEHFEPTEIDREGAADLLTGLADDAGARRCFDPVTLEKTANLAKEWTRAG